MPSEFIYTCRCCSSISKRTERHLNVSWPHLCCIAERSLALGTSITDGLKPRKPLSLQGSQPWTLNKTHEPKKWPNWDSLDHFPIAMGVALGAPDATWKWWKTCPLICLHHFQMASDITPNVPRLPRRGSNISKMCLHHFWLMEAHWVNTWCCPEVVWEHGGLKHSNLELKEFGVHFREMWFTSLGLRA